MGEQLDVERLRWTNLRAGGIEVAKEKVGMRQIHPSGPLLLLSLPGDTRLQLLQPCSVDSHSNSQGAL